MYKAVCIISAALLCFVAAAQDVCAQASQYVWAQVPSTQVNPGTADLRGIWGFDNATSQQMQLFVVGQAGKIFHYANGIWAQESTGETRDLNSVYGFGAQSVLAVADSNRAIYYYNGSWKKRSSDNLNDALYSVWGTDPYNSFASGKLRTWSIILSYYYNIYKINISNSDNIGRTESSGIKGDRYGIWGTSENNVYMVGAPAATCSTTSCSGTSHISRYNGSGWAPVTTGYDATTLYGIWGTSDNDIFAVGQSGTILHHDSGSTWTKMTSNTTVTLRCVWGTSPNNVFAVGDAGTILHYNGTSWQALASGTTAALKSIWGSSSGDLYAVGGNGTILHGAPVVYTSWYRDADGDGYGDAAVTTLAGAKPDGYVADSTDCNDSSAGINPGATETCNGSDDDCDGESDEGFNIGAACSAGVGACYSAGVRSCSAGAAACTAVAGTPAAETCNGIDDDCNGQADDGLNFSAYYRDADGDAFGNAAVSVVACAQPAEYVPNSTDCDDNNTAINPAAAEICNGSDENCDGQADDGFNVGASCSAGVGACFSTGVTVCASGAAVCTAVPGTPTGEVCNGSDDDCDGETDEGVKTTYYRDADGDAFGNAAVPEQACEQPTGYVANGADCNDNSTAVNPAAAEICNGRDDNCDGQADEGFNVGALCTAGVGACFSTGVTVCASGAAVCTAVPGTPTGEVCNGTDDDCDGTTDEGFNVGALCSAGVGACYSTGLTVCASGAAVCTAVAGAPTAEICNGTDDNCDGQIDEQACITTTTTTATDAAADGDGVADSQDNCPADYNPLQLDADADGDGDVCDPAPGCGGCGMTACEHYADSDRDGIPDPVDTCPAAGNPQQFDADGDGIGDACDQTPGCGGCGQPRCEAASAP